MQFDPQIHKLTRNGNPWKNKNGEFITLKDGAKNHPADVAKYEAIQQFNKYSNVQPPLDNDAPDWAKEEYAAPQKEYIQPAQVVKFYPEAKPQIMEGLVYPESLDQVRINYAVRDRDGTLIPRTYVLGELIHDVGKHVEYELDLNNTLINLRSKRGYTECANLKQPPKNIVSAAYNLSFR